MLDPVLLRAFLTVVQTGGFTRAAASLHLTQSTVSQQVRRLEEQVGAELLERGGALCGDHHRGVSGCSVMPIASLP